MITVSGFEVQDWVFPGGEVGVKLHPQVIGHIPEIIKVVAKILNSEDLMKLIMVKDALDRLTGCHGNVQLHLPYLPYAQQDRVCHPGESFSLGVVADLIDYMDFTEVVLYDVHSEVALRQFVTPVHYIGSHIILSKNSNMHYRLHKNKFTLVAPDKGATERTMLVYNNYGMKNSFIQCHKTRCSLTGAIESVEVLSGDVAGKDCLIVDDICLAGGTFIPIAQKLKEMGATNVSLYVTHGIFNKGVNHLLTNGIDWIYTSDSRVTEEVANHKNVTVIPLGV